MKFKSFYIALTLSLLFLFTYIILGYYGIILGLEPKESIGDIAPKVAAKYFSSAVTLIHGRLKKNDPFYLPRIGLYKEDLKSLARLKTLI